ncbi:Spy/CpxP family protein refolding chaperone [Candidatus Margulisiibacteriota bacterium]
MKRIIILSLCLFLSLSIASFAADNDADVDETISSGTSVDNVTAQGDMLKLTKEQREKLRNIKTDTANENAKLVRQRNEIRSEIRTMMDADEPDLGKVESKVKELENVRSKITLNKLSGAKKANGVLTKSQKSKMKAVRTQRREPRKAKIKEMKKQMKMEKTTPMRTSPTRTAPSRGRGR